MFRFHRMDVIRSPRHRTGWVPVTVVIIMLLAVVGYIGWVLYGAVQVPTSRCFNTAILEYSYCREQYDWGDT